MSRYWKTLMMLTPFLLVLSASAQDSLGISRIGEMNDYWTDTFGYYRMEIFDDRAYLSTGESGLHIFNLFDQEDPEEIAGIPIHADDVVRRGDLLYVVDWNFRIINIADLNNPVEVAVLDTIAYGAIVLSGDYAFVLSHDNKDEAYGYVLAIDVSDPAEPVVAGTYYPDALECVLSDIAIQDDLMYVSDSWLGSLFVVDISDPENMQEIGSNLYEWMSPTIDVLGDYAFLVENSVRIIDVSDPENISQLTTISWESVEQEDEPDWDIDACGVAVNEQYVFVTTSTINGLGQYVTGHLRAVDISNPEFPDEVGSVEIPQFPSQVELWVDCAIVYGAKGGVTVIDVFDPENMQIVGGLNKGHALGIVVNEGLAYIASGSAGLRSYEMNDPTSPRLLGEIDTPGYAEDVVIDGNIAYVSDQAHKLRIINIDNPDEMFEVGHFDERTDRVFIDGDYAYIAGWRLYIVDVSDPSEPFQVGEYRHISSFTDVVVSNGIAYLSAKRANRDGGGLVVLNVSDPEDPELMVYYDTRCSLNRVTLYDHTVYASSYIFDVSEPANPQLLGRYDSGTCEVFYDHYMFTCDYGDGVRCRDISNPAEPQIVGFYPVDNSCVGLAFEVPYLYATFINQVVIYDCSEAIGFNVVPDNPESSPIAYDLLSAYPNPFNSSVLISFTNPKVGSAVLDVYDQAGRIIDHLFESGSIQAGRYRCHWRPAAGVSSGEYFVTLRINKRVKSIPVTLIR